MTGFPKTNHICVGTASLFMTSVIGQLIISFIVALIAVHYVYNLSYNPVCQQVMEFLQELLLGDLLPSSRKTTTAYSNLFRALNCIQQKFFNSDGADSAKEFYDEEETQDKFDI